jgi:hypothetical protein
VSHILGIFPRIQLDQAVATQTQQPQAHAQGSARLIPGKEIQQQPPTNRASFTGIFRAHMGQATHGNIELLPVQGVRLQRVSRVARRPPWEQPEWKRKKG